MSLDERLTTALQDVARSHEPSTPDLPGIVHGGRRRRRARGVRRAAVAGVVALAVAAGAPFALGALEQHEPARPAAPVDQTVTDLPIGAKPSIPYCTEHDVIGTDVPIHAPCAELVHRGSATLRLAEEGVQLLQDGRWRMMSRRGWTYWFPGVSHDGSYAAWVSKAPGTETGAELLVYDLTSGEQIARVRWPTTEGWVPGIDDQERVYFDDFAGGVSYFDIRSGATVAVRGLPERVSGGARVPFVTSDGFGLTTVPASRTVVVGVVTDDGRFSRQRVVTQGASTYSPDGDHFVHETEEGLAVSSTDGDEENVLLDLPEPGGPTWFPVWETDDTLLVQFDPESAETSVEFGADGYGLDVPAHRTYLLRCDADSGDCEVALEPGWGNLLRHPLYR